MKFALEMQHNTLAAGSPSLFGDCPFAPSAAPKLVTNKLEKKGHGTTAAIKVFETVSPGAAANLRERAEPSGPVRALH